MKKHKSILINIFSALAITVKAMLSLRYKVTIKGAEIVKNSSPVLILPNHPALIDPIILMSNIYQYTNAIPVISSTYYDIPLLKFVFEGLGAVRVSDLGAGSRNINVLNHISRSILKGFRRGKNIVLYPSGQLASQGYEKIFNKKSAQIIVSKIPDDVTIIGVRTTGLWGSMWSKARTGKSPNFMILLLKGMFYILANFIFFLPRRTITIEIEDLTLLAKKNAQFGRKTFNQFLEDFYNLNGEEDLNLLSHLFYIKS